MIIDAHLKIELKFHNSVILPKFYGKSSQVEQMIFLSAPIRIPNIKAPAKILFEISCTQDFQFLFSEGHNSKKRHDLDMKKYTGRLFSHEQSVNEI